MSRRVSAGSIDDITRYGLVALGAYAALQFGANGRFGAQFQQTAVEILAALGVPRTALGVASGTSAGGSGTSPASTSATAPARPGGGITSRPLDTGHPCSNALPSISPLVAANANFASQMMQWVAERGQRGEDPTDWAELRWHLVSIGAPDPGSRPPPEFCPSLGAF